MVDPRRDSQARDLDLHAAPSVYVTTESEADFERKLWKQIALLLTGLAAAKLRQLGVVLVDPFARREPGRVD